MEMEEREREQKKMRKMNVSCKSWNYFRAVRVDSFVCARAVLSSRHVGWKHDGKNHVCTMCSRKGYDFVIHSDTFGIYIRMKMCLSESSSLCTQLRTIYTVHIYTPVIDLKTYWQSCTSLRFRSKAPRQSSARVLVCVCGCTAAFVDAHTSALIYVLTKIRRRKCYSIAQINFIQQFFYVSIAMARDEAKYRVELFELPNNSHDNR